MDVLQLDISGRPQAWISPREAAILYASDAVAWTLGETFQVLRGGTQRATGRQSRIEVHPIVAVRGTVPSRAWRQTPALTNPKLLLRDRQVCAYCGGHFHLDELTREHIVPVSRGRAGQLDELHHRLPRLQRPQGQPPARRSAHVAAVPALRAQPARRHDPARRRIVADQMEFLLASVPRSSRLHG
jgi:hypothetical protein